MRRGLLLVEMIWPKSPGLIMCPVFGLMPEDGIALRLLIGLAKFTWLKRLKNSARNSMFFASPNGRRSSMQRFAAGCEARAPPYRELGLNCELCPGSGSALQTGQARPKAEPWASPRKLTGGLRRGRACASHPAAKP